MTGVQTCALPIWDNVEMTVFNWLFGGHFPITWSLGIIIGVIALSIVASLLFPKKPPEDKPQP